MTENRERDYFDIAARVSWMEGHSARMEINTSLPGTNVVANIPLDTFDPVVASWLYIRLDALLTEFRQRVLEGDFDAEGIE